MPNPVVDTTLAMDIAEMVATPTEDKTAADGLQKRDSSKRESELRRILCRDTVAEARHRDTFHYSFGWKTAEAITEALVQFFTDCFLAAIHKRGWRIYKEGVHCPGCRAAIDAQYTEFLKSEPGRIERAERIMAEARQTQLEILNAEKAKKEAEIGKPAPKAFDPFAVFDEEDK